MSLIMQNLRKATSMKTNLFRCQSKFLSTSNDITIPLGDSIFATHNFEAPSSTVTTNKDELMSFFKQMYIMRRVEITNDTEYKVFKFVFKT